jgi:acetyl esterase/lipase
MAPEIYEAIRQGRDHILEHAAKFDVDPSRVGIMGMSTGGLLTLLLALDMPQDARSADRERATAAVVYMPIVDMRDVVDQVRATPSLCRRTQPSAPAHADGRRRAERAGGRRG